MWRLSRFVGVLLVAAALSGCTVVAPYAERALFTRTLAVETREAVASEPITPTGSQAATPQRSPDVTQLALPNQQLEQLGRAILEQELLERVAGDLPITLLAPDDAAFARLDPAYVERLLADREALTTFLQGHMIRGMWSLADLARQPASTLDGEPLKVVLNAEGMTIDGARVIQGDMAVPFGLVHVIDRVLVGPEAGGESTGVTRTETTTQTPEIPTSTPTASSSPTASSTVRPSGTATAKTTQGLTATPTASPTVLPSATATPPPTITPTVTPTTTPTARPTTTSTPAPTATPMPTVVPTVVLSRLDVMGRLDAMAELSTFAGLMERAGLDDWLRSQGAVTVLAPTDDAFGELTEAEISALQADRTALRAWLLRYVLPGRFSAGELARMSSITASSGDVLPIRSRNGLLIIGGTRVLERDLAGTNGLIHTVDTVVLP